MNFQEVELVFINKKSGKICLVEFDLFGQCTYYFSNENSIFQPHFNFDWFCKHYEVLGLF